jgi:hypothetical protein
MKNFLLIVALLFLNALMNAGCLKKEKREGDYAIDLGGVHCQNNIMDANELGTDCGGSCAPCEQNKAPCTLAPNTLYIQNETGSLEAKELVTSNIDTLENGHLQFLATLDNSINGLIQLTFNQKINLAQTYTGTEFDQSSGNFVQVVYTESGWDDRLGSGTVYVYIDDEGKYIIESCSYKFQPSSPQFIEFQWFNLSF